MRIEAVQPVAAAPERVFSRVADFENLEARAARRGIPVERLERDPPGWRIGVDWKGMSYTVDMQIEAVTPPAGYTATLATRGVDGTAAIAITPDGAGSLLSVAVDVEGRGLTGRMVLQAVGFARTILEARLAGALRRLAAEIEGAA